MIYIRHRFRGRKEVREEKEAEKYVLLKIENYVQSMVGKTFVKFGLPEADLSLELISRRERLPMWPCTVGRLDRSCRRPCSS